jgi:hypothetical protein
MKMLKAAMAAKKRKERENIGGEPLWPASYGLAGFSLARVQPKSVNTGGSRELPSVFFLPNHVC